MNTAIAEAEDAVEMAKAMNLGVRGGAACFLAGRMPKKLYLRLVVRRWEWCGRSSDEFRRPICWGCCFFDDSATCAECGVRRDNTPEMVACLAKSLKAVDAELNAEYRRRSRT